MTLFNQRRARLLVPGFHPDPSVCSDRPGHLVLAFSSFEYFPGLPVWESTDSGRTWSFCSHAASRPEQFTTTPLGNSQGFYAPTIRFHAGTWYLIVTDVNRGAMIFRTRDLHGPWSGPVMVEGWPGIDPSLLFDADGTCYICGNEAGSGERPGIYAARIDPDSGKVLSGRHFLIGGITGSNPEGPHLYRHGDRYYLMWAEGGTEAGHMECLARADSVFGPYETDPHNPLLTNRSTHLNPQCIGHADFAPLGPADVETDVETGGSGDAGSDTDGEEDFLVFLGLRTNADYPQQGWLGRENFGATMRWKDGWPDLCDQSFLIDTDDTGAALPYADPTDAWITPGVDHTSGQGHALFHVEGLGNDANPEGTGQRAVSVTVSALPETGDPLTDFDSLRGPRLIGRRQTGFDDDFAVDAESLADGRTGVIVYANARVWARAFVDSRSQRLLCEVEDLGLRTVLADLPLPEPGASDPSTRPVFHVHASDEGYDLSVSFEDSNGNNAARTGTFLGHVPCQIFASTHAGGFTGLLYGVWARGTGTARFLCR